MYFAHCFCHAAPTSKHVIFGSSLVSKSMKVMTNTKELLFRVASETGLLRRNQFRWSL